jgi:hypothetical protein
VCAEMSIVVFKVIFPLAGSVIFLALSYGWARSLSNPLTVIQKKMLVFGGIFAVGMSYLLMWQYDLSAISHMPHLYLLGILLWAIVSGFITSRINFKDPDDEAS